MPINKYHSRDLNKMRDTINIDSAMFTPKLDDIFGLDRLVKGDMLECSYGIASFPEMRSMHSTIAMTMALGSVKRYHTDIPIFHTPYEQLEFHPTDYGIKERLGLFPDIDCWGTSVSRYDEEKVKVYKIPSKDRLDMLVRIYKIIKGNKK